MERSRHHIIAKNNGGNYYEDNLIVIDRRLHDCIHLLFGNDLPFEIIRGITERYKKVMDNESYEMMNGVLTKVEGKIESYNPKCFYKDRLSSYISRKGK